MPAIPPRNKVPKRNTWNAESVFATEAAWAGELESVLADLARVRTYRGKLGDGASGLLEALNARDELSVRAQRVYMYASFMHAVDTTNQKAAGMQGRATSMEGQVAAALSFFAPELISVGQI